jgi:hypothetical protein
MLDENFSGRAPFWMGFQLVGCNGNQASTCYGLPRVVGFGFRRSSTYCGLPPVVRFEFLWSTSCGLPLSVGFEFRWSSTSCGLPLSVGFKFRWSSTFSGIWISRRTKRKASTIRAETSFRVGNISTYNRLLWIM